jgi:thiamine-phosphate pyrophosphorylase
VVRAVPCAREAPMTSHAPDPSRLRERLQSAQLLLLFSPELCRSRDPLAVLEAVLSEVDIVQVRPKPAGRGASSLSPCGARETFEWCERVLDLVRARPALDVIVMVDDRVDVARALWDAGCAGVHLGQDDCPVATARRFLGPGPLLGLSTHDFEQVIEADELAVDMLGFGPVHATHTKGYAEGLGAEMAWIASSAGSHPLFAIGGIDVDNAAELARVGRIAVASAILGADDPARAARELREQLTLDQDEA